MSRPDDIPQWAWDEAIERSDKVGEMIFTHAPQEELDLPVIIARAILKAKNDAYEEAAKVSEADGLREVQWAEMSLPVSPGPIIAKDREKVAIRISQAIRNLKHETEV